MLKGKRSKKGERSNSFWSKKVVTGTFALKNFCSHFICETFAPGYKNIMGAKMLWNFALSQKHLQNKKQNLNNGVKTHTLANTDRLTVIND